MTKLMKRFMDFDPIPWAFPSTFDKAFQELFGNFDSYDPEHESWKINKGFPRGDLFKKDNEAIIELALAGYDKEQLSITVEDNKLIVSAKKCEGEETQERALTRKAFREEYRFNKDYDLENAQASFKNGLLRISVPKIKEQEKIIKQLTIE